MVLEKNKRNNFSYGSSTVKMLSYKNAARSPHLFQKRYTNRNREEKFFNF